MCAAPARRPRRTRFHPRHDRTPPARPAPARGRPSARAARSARRSPRAARGDPQPRADVGDPLRLTMLQHMSGGGVGDRQSHAAHVPDVAGARLHDQLLAVAQHDHEAAGAHQRASALDDQLQHVLERDLPADRDGHVAGRLDASKRLLELLAAALAGLICPRVVDRDRRPVGEDHRGLLVLFGELTRPASRSDTGCPTPARGS